MSFILLASLVGSLMGGSSPLETVGTKNLQDCKLTWGGRQEELEPQCPETVTWQVLALSRLTPVWGFTFISGAYHPEGHGSCWSQGHQGCTKNLTGSAYVKGREALWLYQAGG